MIKIIKIWLKSLIFFNLFLFIAVVYLSKLKSHNFHIDEYGFMRKSYFFNLFVRKNFKDSRWQSDNFNQPKLGPYIYGLALRLNGIKDTEKFQNKIKFNEIKINNRFWWKELLWEKPADFPSQLNSIIKLIVQGRKVATFFSLAALLLILILGILTKNLKFAFFSILILAFNRLMFYYGRLAMTDSFQLFFFLLNLILIIYYLRYFFQKNKKLVLILSLFIGINAALTAGVKVIGILALIFYLGIFLILFFLNPKPLLPRCASGRVRFGTSKCFSKKLMLLSLLIVFFSFFFLFVFLNPQIYSQPFKGFIKMFTTRWQSAIVYQKTVGLSVNTKTDGLKLIFERLLLTNNRSGNFWFLPFIPADLIFLFGGIFLLFKKAWLRFKKTNQLSLEAVLLLWSGLTFLSLIFYLKNDWPRYYLPLAMAITLIQAYFLAWCTEKIFVFLKNEVFTKLRHKNKVWVKIFKSLDKNQLLRP